MNENGADWPFEDPQNVAVFTTKRVIRGDDWISYVTHDIDDGAWQFHGPSSDGQTEEAALVRLDEIIMIEPRLKELADLPLGWHAWRIRKDAPWTREMKVV